MGLLANFLRRGLKKPAPQVLRFLVKRSSGRKACVVEIRNDQSFTDLDFAIRRAFDYDGWDHCSAFFEGVPWRSRCLTKVYPDYSAPGQRKPLSILPFAPGIKLGYVYDFGDDLQHVISVEDVLPIDPQKEYPAAVLVTPSPASRRKNSSRGRRKNA